MTDEHTLHVKIIATEAICASGVNKNQIFEACLTQQSSVLEDGLAPISSTVWADLKLQKAASESHALLASVHCLRNTLDEAGWSASELSECGFIFATTTSQIDQWQKSLPFCFLKNLSFTEITEAAKYQSLGITLIQLQTEFQIHGPSSVIASSCSASLQALSLAALWIKTGQVKRCIVGSTEILSDLTTNGFNSMRLLTKGICKPFDANRSGINLGEASAFICLEADNVSERKALGYVSGFGLSSDAYHPTSPQPDGKGSLAAMKMALKQAHLSPENIDWFHAHGTGSQANDLAETKAIKSLFKDNDFKKAAVSSTKSIHGHTLGACGALEVVLALISLDKNLILPTHNTNSIDPTIELDIVLKPREKIISHILKNSLGFGGINATVILSKEIGLN
ncbi:MAG: beta-ketoacyl-[acyl-carrier-protein] synthase family protein [Pseudobdellovibrio sp.]